MKKKRRTSVDVEIKSKEHLLMWKSKEIDADADHLMLMLMGLQMVLIRTIEMGISWKGWRIKGFYSLPSLIPRFQLQMRVLICPDIFDIYFCLSGQIFRNRHTRNQKYKKTEIQKSEILEIQKSEIQKYKN